MNVHENILGTIGNTPMNPCSAMRSAASSVTDAFAAEMQSEQLAIARRSRSDMLRAILGEKLIAVMSTNATREAEM